VQLNADVLTVDELMQLLKIGRNAAYELANRPDFPALRLGKKIRVPRAALERWLEEQTKKDV